MTTYAPHFRLTRSHKDTSQFSYPTWPSCLTAPPSTVCLLLLLFYIPYPGLVPQLEHASSVVQVSCALQVQEQSLLQLGSPCTITQHTPTSQLLSQLLRTQSVVFSCLSRPPLLPLLSPPLLLQQLVLHHVTAGVLLQQPLASLPSHWSQTSVAHAMTLLWSDRFKPAVWQSLLVPAPKVQSSNAVCSQVCTEPVRKSNSLVSSRQRKSNSLIISRQKKSNSVVSSSGNMQKKSHNLISSSSSSRLKKRNNSLFSSFRQQKKRNSSTLVSTAKKKLQGCASGILAAQRAIGGMC